MRFDWKQESKEQYFRRAEEQIEKAGFVGFLNVDRSQFGVVGDRSVKVYTQPIHHAGNMRLWWQAKRTIENFKEVEERRNQFGKKIKRIYLKGCFEIEMDGGENIES